MAELLQQERLQPSLLDRLTDDAPEAREESRDKRVLGLTQLRQSVLRDVGWLLNTVHLQASQDLSEWPQVASSTVNYGIPDLAGSSVAGRNTLALERAVRQAVLNFEPRILPDTLKVTVRIEPEQMTRHAMSFIIEGQLWAQPVPLSLYLKTELDLETGSVTVAESSR
ncbi:MAG TPA: type VI secretion system baseplate subunit TssE [Povalibacter sp.]|uniref:type VI secretion system baseplate subunit TssE n=1 Tax=Povalibacter sp. TaxID=1962978 RepID=UPI002B5E98F3|nr:type VI secretion system baseplate subunit TssE [Povalibacter sp.]HMN43925.1 type VI secretion system baseplate subunit TssE [Povalibacter sp.]